MRWCGWVYVRLDAHNPRNNYKQGHCTFLVCSEMNW